MTDQHRHDGEEDFDVFWAAHRAAQNPQMRRILGVDVQVPTDIPLLFEDKFSELKESQKPEHFAELLVILFGEGTFEKWKANGLTAEQLRVLSMWGVANASGRPTTFTQAAGLVAQAEAVATAGKAPANRAARRAGSRGSSPTGASAGGGRTSSRTSAASTGTRRTS